MATIMEAFERYDVDGDNALSVEEFLKYRASTSGLRGPASRELADIEMGSCVPLFLCSPCRMLFLRSRKLPSPQEQGRHGVLEPGVTKSLFYTNFFTAFRFTCLPLTPSITTLFTHPSSSPMHSWTVSANARRRTLSWPCPRSSVIG
jgi:hypothetical protein